MASGYLILMYIYVEKCFLLFSIGMRPTHSKITSKKCSPATGIGSNDAEGITLFDMPTIWHSLHEYETFFDIKLFLANKSS